MKFLIPVLLLLFATAVVSASSVCDGTATACGEFGELNCTAQAGCSLNETTCEGTETACDALLDVDSCASQYGCDWEYKAYYTSLDIASVSIDSVIGIFATIFLFASVIGIIILWRWTR